MKKILALLLVFSMCIGMLATSAFAEEATAVVTVGKVQVCPIEGTATVSVEIANNPGFNNIMIDVVYNHDVLQLKEATNAQMPAEFICNAKEDRIVAAGTYNVTDNGKMFDITFDLKPDAEGNYAEGDYEVSIDILVMANEADDLVDNTVTAGTVTVGHVAEVIPGTGATCEGTGLTDGSKCSVCGETLVAQEVIGATGHTAGEVKIENSSEGICETKGSYDKVIYCTVCGDELSRETITVDAPGHVEGAVVVENEVAADCVNDGSYDKVVYCSVCKTELSRETITVDAHGHTEGDVVVENEVAADCVNDGSYDNVHYCVNCGDEFFRETVTVPALGHTAGEVKIENSSESICETKGSYDNVIYCTACGDELSRETITVDAPGHTAGTVVVENEVAADCVNDGSYDKVVYCSVCKTELSRETVIVPATGEHIPGTGEAQDGWHIEYDANGNSLYHYQMCLCGEIMNKESHNDYYVFETVLIKEATHSEDGLKQEIHTCSVCGYKVVREIIIPKGVHRWKEIVIAPTCTKWGCTLHICLDKDCTADYADGYLPANGHAYETVVTAPTCTEGGYTTYTCSACGDSYVGDETEATGHGPYTVLFNGSWATCTEDANWTVICESCGHEFDKAEWQSWGTINGWKALGHNFAEATCTEDGACTRCGEVNEPATGHNYQGTDSKAPTCTEPGYKKHVCTNCGDEQIVETPLVDHEWVAPTCDNAGYCAVCGEAGEAALGHNWQDGEGKAPTCTEDGYGRRSCPVCGASQSWPIEATGHTWGEGIVTTEPTEEAEGVKTYTCACGETKTEALPKLEHVHKYEAVVTAPTCEEEGYTTYTCACGDSYIGDKVDATGHNFDESGFCTNCGSAKTGDNTVLLLALIAMIAMTGAAVVVMKKKYF